MFRVCVFSFVQVGLSQVRKLARHVLNLGYLIIQYVVFIMKFYNFLEKFSIAEVFFLALQAR